MKRASGWFAAAMALGLAACVVQEPDDKDDKDPPEQPSGPCQGITSDGVCASPSEVKRCVVATGQGDPTLVSETCAAHEECTVAEGVAACTPLPGKCVPGASSCSGPDTASVCNEAGDTEEVACTACSESPIGVVCQGGPTVEYHGVIGYEARGPNAELTDWAEPSLFYAAGLLAVSFKAAGGEMQIVDATIVNDEGEFDLAVPADATSDDLVAFFAVRPTEDGSAMSFGLMQPPIGDGEWNVGDPLPTDEAGYWFWSVDPTTLDPMGFELIITEDLGSGAMRVFDYLRYVHDSVAELTGAPGKSLVVWFRPNTSWSCGACFAPWPIEAGGNSFASQMWIPATAQDQSFWADPVTAHELGHWVMASYGTSPNEGGTHCLGVPTFPGQAWSEGFATGFSSLVRGNPYYYDKQGGGFFWLDLSNREYSGSLWQRPDAGLGLIQLIDENEVAAMMWEIAEHPAEGSSLGANAHFLDALRSDRMNGAAFARGYTWHTWQVAEGCQQVEVQDLGESKPMFADYLDALACGGVGAAAIDQATDPGAHYPYPSSSPICQ